jgi:pyrroline-5-carboxylate reductase
MSNQYGLTIDNMAAYELVLPNGTITTVTESNEDLWFALRGGGNNFVCYFLARLVDKEVD